MERKQHHRHRERGPNRLREAAAGGADPSRLDDPEYVWKMEEKRRWASLMQLPDRQKEEGPSGGKPPAFISFRAKAGISALLFGLVWGMFQIDHPYAEKGRLWVTQALTIEADFGKWASYYAQSFSGAPSFLPAFLHRDGTEARKANAPAVRKLYIPAHGKIEETESGGALGITLRTRPDAKVAALDTGRVVDIRTGTERGTVVVLQHADGLESIYGWLKETSVKKYDWLLGGETFASVSTDPANGTGKLYIAVRKNGQYVAPTDVISFD
jgi:stage IV sporulation protein FA